MMEIGNFNMNMELSVSIKEIKGDYFFQFLGYDCNIVSHQGKFWYAYLSKGKYNMILKAEDEQVNQLRDAIGVDFVQYLD